MRERGFSKRGESLHLQILGGQDRCWLFLVDPDAYCVFFLASPETFSGLTKTTEASSEGGKEGHMYKKLLSVNPADASNIHQRWLCRLAPY